MIHVDVSTDRYERDDPNNHYPKVLVQTSVDGGPWETQYVFYASGLGDNALADEDEQEARDRQRRDAEEAARVFVNGCRFAGAEVRGTSFGYAL